MTGKKILLVEDDPFLSEMYTAKLIEAGFAVETADNGLGALEKLKENRPDLILLDLVLPKMDGFSVLREIRASAELKGLRIIAFTNLGQKEEVEKGLTLGADDYIVKAHFTPSEVVAKVKDILK